MTDGENRSAPPPRGDRRADDRRAKDRRRTDRRLPLPWWRMPWVMVGLGVLATLIVVAVFSLTRGDDGAIPRTDEALLVDAPPPAPPPPPSGPAEDASASADFERLVAEGEAAVGRLVRVELYCNAINSISMRSVENTHPSLAAVADTLNKVPAAECKWGQDRDVRRDDLMLVVPAELAGAFTGYPMVQDRFVSRRRVRAEIEWLGRSDALALRPAGVLRTPL